MKPSSSRHIVRTSSAVLLGATALWLAGCASGPESHIVSSPPPPPPGAAPATTPTVVVAPTPVPGATAPQTIVVTQAPPAAQTEVAKERPSSRHVWVPGYWSWQNSRYTWVAGRWEVPPHSGARWIAPHFEPVDGAYRFYEGYWE